MSGIVLQLKTSPRDTSLVSMPVVYRAAAGTTAIVSFYQQNQAMARSVQVVNLDSANAASLIVNNDRANSINIPPSGAIGLTDQWIEQIEVAAGAANRCDILGEIVPLTELRKRGNNV
jgi:hypothetical protein